MKRKVLSAAAVLLITAFSSRGQSSDSSVQNQSATDQKVQSESQAAKSAGEEAGRASDKSSATDRKQKGEAERSRAAADKARNEAERKFGEYDEIVIKKKNVEANEKITIEIKDNDVIVNGKPIEVFADDNVAVKIRSPRRYTMVSPRSPFRSSSRTWSMEGSPEESLPFLGVMTESASGGAKILSVTENSAAAAAGLKTDDIITQINGKAVSSHEEITAIITALKPEDKVTITYKRNGKEKKTTATLGKRTVMTRSFRGGPDDNFEAPEPPEAPERPEPRERFDGPVPPIPPMNFNFDDLQNNLNNAFNMDGRPRVGIKAQDTEDGKGVKVLDVDDDSPAEKAGLKEDDIITSYDGKTVNSARELAEASRAAKDKLSVKVQLKRKGKSQELELKVPRKLRTADL